MTKKVENGDRESPGLQWEDGAKILLEILLKVLSVIHPPNDHPTTKGTNEGLPPRILSPKKEFFGFVERTSGSEGPGMEV